MSKFTYILICFLLSFKFWNLSFTTSFLNSNAILVLSWLWALSAFLFFRGKPRFKVLYSKKYIQYMYWIFLGVFISMFSAYYFWGQSFLTTFIAQRFVYNFILILAILYVQPSENDILRALKWISIATIIIWIAVAINPSLKVITEEILELKENSDTTDLGYSVAGIKFVVLYLYFKIQEYIKKFTWQTFTQAMLLLTFVFVFQNRSMLLGVIPVLIYSLFQFRSKYKSILIFALIGILSTGIVYSQHIWMSLLNETQSQLNNPDYNRWKAFYYYLYDHSPNWFCYIFGNGFPSLKSGFGDHISYLRSNGIFASDIGMIGMWSNYGIIPSIVLYSIIIKILFEKKFPLYLKFICFHIIFVPTIFQYWVNPGIFFFVLIIYLFAYHKEVVPAYQRVYSNNLLYHEILRRNPCL